MDRAIAIETYQAALTRIVAALIAMVGLAQGGGAARLPQALYRAVWRVLCPAESAVRRLIVIAACGLKVKLSPPRPNAKGPGPGREGGGRLSFQLFDTRKRFDLRPRYTGPRPVPRIFGFGVSPLTPLFQPQPAFPADTPSTDEFANPERLGRRLAAIKMALENLPRQAKRLVRWQARRDRMQSPKFRSPLRPGPPPGHRKEPEEEVDLVLLRCHALAREALSEDTS
ncbi:hypothetical protein BH10PSE7_BH10PSE7_22650 [soil metagenome]